MYDSERLEIQERAYRIMDRIYPAIVEAITAELDAQQPAVVSMKIKSPMDLDDIECRVMHFLEEAGPDGLPKGKIADKIRVEESILDEVLLKLRGFDAIRLDNFKPKTGRPSKRYVWNL